MQLKLAVGALALSGCIAHGHYGHHHHDALDALLTAAVIVADVAQAVQTPPEPVVEPPPRPPTPAEQAEIDARREMLDHLADEIRAEALAGDCGTAAGTARMVARVDEGYFRAYVLSDPDVQRCLPWLQRI